MKRRFYLLFLFFILLIIKDFYHRINLKRESITIVLENNYLGEIESLIEYGDHSVIGVHYPLFHIDKIDTITKELVDKYINSFKRSVAGNIAENNNYKSELNIDYKIYKGPNNIVNVEFIIWENINYYAHPHTIIETRVYDINVGSVISLDHIMIGKYLNRISELSIDYFTNNEPYKDNILDEVFYKNMRPNNKNYSTFLLLEDRITFIFNKYTLFPGFLGNARVDILYIKLQDYLKTNFQKAIDPSMLSIKDNETVKDVFSETNDVKVISSSRKIDPLKPMIALTFDDGPYIKTTGHILDTLEEHNAVATFFVLGNRVANNKQILSRMINEGNEIGNHSYNHKQLTKLPASELKNQINRTQNEVIKALGSEPKVMRPTYGSYNQRLQSQIKMPMILWSIDTMDWKNKDAETIIAHVLDNVKNGDIILMHDIYESTVEAVEYLIPALINKGYQLVTVSELYESQGEVLEVGNIYRKFKGTY